MDTSAPASAGSTKQKLPKNFNREFWEHVIMLLRTGQLTGERLFSYNDENYCQVNFNLKITS